MDVPGQNAARRCIFGDTPTDHRNLAVRNGRQHAPQFWPRSCPPVLAKRETPERLHMRHDAATNLTRGTMVMYLTARVSLGVRSGLWPKDAHGAETFSGMLGLPL